MTTDEVRLKLLEELDDRWGHLRRQLSEPQHDYDVAEANLRWLAKCVAVLKGFDVATEFAQPWEEATT